MKTRLKFNLFSIVLVTVATLLMVVAISYTALKFAERDIPLIDAAEGMKFELAQFHLWLEEAMQGDKSVKEEDIFSHLDKAAWYVNAMLNGGEDEESVYVPIEHAESRYHLGVIENGMTSLREGATARLRNHADSKPGSEADILFDQVYHETITYAEIVENSIQEAIDEDIELVTNLLTGLVTGILSIAIIFSLLYFRYERNRENFLQYLEQQVSERTQELNLAKNKAEEANHAKTMFLSSMSHELRTPLNAILGFAQLMEMDDHDVNGKEMGKEIVTAGKHLLNLINEVLDIAKIESGKVELDIRENSLEKLLSDSIRFIRPLATKRNIHIEDHASEQIIPAICVDSTRFKQVLINILSNAVKYNKENGSIFIKCHINDDDTIHLDITDTGNGIAEDMQKLVFEPFERVNEEVKAIEGIGLGLPISRQLLELMGCSISLQSTVGKGSCFTIHIPTTRH